MFKFYQVGGAVRDRILGLESKDIDYVAVPEEDLLLTVSDTKVMFEVLRQHLEKEGFQIFLVTEDCYTIRAKYPKGHKLEKVIADFVMARKEIGYEENTRKPIVAPGTLYDDLARRDFTMNAIAMDEDGTYIDPFNGMQDIEKKQLRSPISGEVSFEDDPLRILRAIRFSITKDFYIPRELSMIIHHFNYEDKFHVVSDDRIREELYKCFKHNTLRTLRALEYYFRLKNYIFSKNLWLKPTTEK
jgi:tRNA nucleotidyltransferase/poly(A) polymerase